MLSVPVSFTKAVSMRLVSGVEISPATPKSSQTGEFQGRLAALWSMDTAPRDC
jgi:hypothetical protein